jgi:hypothetical protein
MHPMATSTNVRRNLRLVDKKRRDEVYVSPAKKRTVQREVAKERRRVLSEFTNGEQIDRTEGSLTRMCEKIYIQNLVAEHKRPGSSAGLSRLSVQKGFRFANYTTPFLLLYGARAVNSEWPVTNGFDWSGSMSNTKFDLVGITTNSLRSRANPIRLAIANNESTDAYEHTYEIMKAGFFQLVGRTLRCDPPCELCAAIEEQVNQPLMRAEVESPKKTKKKKGQACRKRT